MKEMPPHIGGHWERDRLTVVVSGKGSPYNWQSVEKGPFTFGGQREKGPPYLWWLARVEPPFISGHWERVPLTLVVSGRRAPSHYVQ